MDEPNTESEGEDEALPMASTDVEIQELLGLFDAPAFARRGSDLESAIARLHARCARARASLLDMVHVRLRQWASVATGPDDGLALFVRPIAPLWPLSGAEEPTWADRPGPPRRQRLIARQLIASVERFNQRWSAFLEQLDLDRVNQRIDDYNRFYVLEKECALGSYRLATRLFQPIERLTIEDLLAEHPLLPVPELRIEASA